MKKSEQELDRFSVECKNCFHSEWRYVDKNDVYAPYPEPYFCGTCRDLPILRRDPQLRIERILEVLDPTHASRFPEVMRMFYRFVMEEIKTCKKSQS